MESTGTVGGNSHVSSTMSDVRVSKSGLSPTINHQGNDDDDVVNEGLAPLPSLRSMVTGGNGHGTGTGTNIHHHSVHPSSDHAVQKRMMTVI